MDYSKEQQNYIINITNDIYYVNTETLKNYETILEIKIEFCLENIGIINSNLCFDDDTINITSIYYSNNLLKMKEMISIFFIFITQEYLHITKYKFTDKEYYINKYPKETSYFNSSIIFFIKNCRTLLEELFNINYSELNSNYSEISNNFKNTINKDILQLFSFRINEKNESYLEFFSSLNIEYNNISKFLEILFGGNIYLLYKLLNYILPITINNNTKIVLEPLGKNTIFTLDYDRYIKIL